MLDKKIFTAIVATVAASLCCVVPVIAVLAGLGSFASTFSWLEPYHNYLVVFTVILLAYAWWDRLKSEKADAYCACDANGKVKFFSSKKFLAIVTVLATLMLTFPQWSASLLGVEPACASCVSDPDVKESKQLPKKDLKKETTKPLVLNEYKGLTDLKACTSEFVCTGTGYLESDKLMADARKEVKEMHSSVLKKMLDEGEDVIVLDVRVVEQRAEGEIYADDSMAVSRTDIEFVILNKIKNKDATIVTYSRSGGRGLFAAQTLKKLGYKNAYNLKGGLRGWVSLGYPLESALGIITQVKAQ